MTAGVQYLIYEQRVYVDRTGRLVCEIEHHYEVAHGIIQDGLILMFLGSL